MKYNVGDEIFYKGTVEEIDNKSEYGSTYRVDFEVWNDWLPDCAIYTAPPCPVWRDGAKEQPDDSIEAVYRLSKRCAKDNILFTHKSNYYAACWPYYYWLPADEFPMPTLPEPEIEPCPFCETDQESGDLVCERTGVLWQVVCGNCGYLSEATFTEQEAINAHNAVSRQVRHES